MITKKEVSRWLELHPQYKKRSLMYQATALYVRQVLGDIITSHHVEMAITVHRRLQDILPNDEKGMALEKEWRKDNGMQSGVEVAEEVLGYKTFKINGEVRRVKV